MAPVSEAQGTMAASMTESSETSVVPKIQPTTPSAAVTITTSALPEAGPTQDPSAHFGGSGTYDLRFQELGQHL